MEPEIIAAIIGAAGVAVAAIFAGWIAKPSRAPESHKGPEPVNKAAKYVDGLVDFVDGVTDDDPLKVELAINEDGRIILFYDKVWRVHLSHVEYFKKTKRCNFVASNGSSRWFGFPVNDNVDQHITLEKNKITLVYRDKRNDSVRQTAVIDFNVYE